MVWLKNLENLAEKRTVGKCPYCKSDNTDYTLVGDVGKMGFGVIWCNNCMKAYHISRIQITEEYNTNKKIPQKLNYR